MMRKPMVAGNWKMNKTIAEARTLVAEMTPRLRSIQEVEVVLCPPFPALFPVAALLQGTGIGLGAQNMYWEAKGAFTGEVAPGMVSEFCRYVILGHSERRTYFGETDETVNKRIQAAQAAGLAPIVCIGERLSEYESGLKDLDPARVQDLVVAYEPVWAIGTGKAATGISAEAVVHEVIRPGIARMYGDPSAQAVRVLYGGSVTAANAAEFFSQPDIDGALVGGASLKADEFIAIVQAAAK